MLLNPGPAECAERLDGLPEFEARTAGRPRGCSPSRLEAPTVAVNRLSLFQPHRRRFRWNDRVARGSKASRAEAVDRANRDVSNFGDIFIKKIFVTLDEEIVHDRILLLITCQSLDEA